MPTKRNASLIFLTNDYGHVLMQHRTENAPLYPGYWAFFGGGIKENESPREGLKREILEEINYTLNDPKLILEVNYENKNHFGTKYYFLEKYDGKQKIILKEGQGYNWIDLEKLSDLKIAEHNLNVINKIKPILI